MGADGGINIYKYKDVQINWKEIQLNLYVLFSTQFVEERDWQTRELKQVKSWFYNIEKAKEIEQYDIINKTCKEFCDWLHNLCSSCKTPYALDDYILMSYGDNVWDEFGDFQKCFMSIEYDSVETWT